jgi:hypothetical protein
MYKNQALWKSEKTGKNEVFIVTLRRFTLSRRLTLASMTSFAIMVLGTTPILCVIDWWNSTFCS